MPHSAEFTFKAFHFRNASEDAHKQIIQFPFLDEKKLEILLPIMQLHTISLINLKQEKLKPCHLWSFGLNIFTDILNIYMYI